MGAPEIITLAIALLSLLISGLAAYNSYRLTFRQIRIATRSEFGKLLVEVNKEIIRDPTLIYYRDSKRPKDLPPIDHLTQTKLEAFSYIMLNVGEMLFDFYQDGHALSAEEKREWEVWRAMIEDLLHDSSLIREMLGRPDVVGVYAAEYCEFLKGLMARGGRA